MSTVPSFGRVERARYELCAQLGQGGTSMVWLGLRFAAEGAGVVAMKVLRKGGGSQLAAQPLLEEARISSIIRHPNVVPTLDLATVGNDEVLVMPYVHGVTLATLLRSCVRRGAICPADVAARIVHDLLLGLDAAHRAEAADGTPLDLVHRDVSPQNVIVDTSGVARLIDFGIAQTSMTPDPTPRGEIRGKAPYLAPEVLDGKPATQLGDVYSAAVVLWETLCARRLFDAPSKASVFVAILTDKIKPPSAVLGQAVPLDAVVLRGLSRNVRERPASARAFADEILARIELAPRARVGDWVRLHASAELGEREALVRSLQPSTGFSSHPPPAPPSTPRPGPTTSDAAPAALARGHARAEASPGASVGAARPAGRLALWLLSAFLVAALTVAALTVTATHTQMFRAIRTSSWASTVR